MGGECNIKEVLRGQQGPPGPQGPPGNLSGAMQLLGKITVNVHTLADQIITLSGGNKYFIVDMLVFNPSKLLTAASNISISIGPNQTGGVIASINTPLYTNFNITLDAAINMITNYVVGSVNNVLINSNMLHVSVTPTGSSPTPVIEPTYATVDVNLYGYILN